MKAQVTRYHPLLVTLHWVVAILIIGNLAGGKLLLEGLANGDPAKLDALRLHMLGGLVALLLLAGRLVTRFTTARPGAAHTSKPLNWLTAVSHAALYIAGLAMAVTGLGTAQLAGLFPLLQGQPVTIPSDWSAIAPHAGHALFANVLLVLIILHFGGALYHMMKRDGVAGRIWFGKRMSD